MKVIAYIRQSRRTEQTISVKDQRREIQRWKDVEIVQEFVEQDVSGAKSWKERELGAAIAMIRNGEAGGLIVAFQDRLARPTMLEEAEVWEALTECDARLICAAEGTDFRPGDVNGLDSRMLYRIKGAIARAAWERHRLNWNNARRSMIERSVHPMRPLGYEWTRDGKKKGPFEKTKDAACVLAAFEAVGSDEPWTWRQIIATLGVKSQSNARDILQNRVYIGTAYSGDFEKPGAHSAIVSEELYRRVQRKLSKKVEDNPVRGTRGAPALLAKLLMCSGCNHALTRDNSGGNYRCKTILCKGKVSIQAARVEPFMLETALHCHRQDEEARAFVLATGDTWTMHDNGALKDAEDALRDAISERDAIEADTGLAPHRKAQALTAADADVARTEQMLANVELDFGFRQVPHERLLERVKDAGQAHAFIKEYIVGVVKPAGKVRTLPVHERVEIFRHTAVPVVGANV